MSQIPDIAPHAMGSAAKPIRSAAPSSLRDARDGRDVSDVSDGDLVDEHRGQSHARRRAADRLELIEAELQRRGITDARGRTSAIKRHSNDGLIDLARLRADHPELVARYRKPGSEHFFRSRALSAEERT